MITIHNLDCLLGLDLIQDEMVDLIIADPPFHLNKSFDNSELTLSEYYDWCNQWITAYFKKLKPTGSFFIMTAQEHVGRMSYYLDNLGFFKNQIIWLNSSMPVKNKFCVGYQPILWYTKSKKNYTFNYGIEKRDSKAALPWGRKNKAGSIKDIWDDIPFISGGCMASKEAILQVGSKKKAHPAQMPLRLAKRIINYCSHSSDLVVDPFSGSGTVALACAETNRNCIAFEKDEQYYWLSHNRLYSSQPVGELV